MCCYLVGQKDGGDVVFSQVRDGAAVDGDSGGHDLAVQRGTLPLLLRHPGLEAGVSEEGRVGENAQRQADGLPRVSWWEEGEGQGIDR